MCCLDAPTTDLDTTTINHQESAMDMLTSIESGFHSEALKVPSNLQVSMPNLMLTKFPNREQESAMDILTSIESGFHGEALKVPSNLRVSMPSLMLTKVPVPGEQRTRICNGYTDIY